MQCMHFQPLIIFSDEFLQQHDTQTPYEASNKFLCVKELLVANLNALCQKISWNFNAQKTTLR